MRNYEKFIASWEKKRQKGKAQFIVSNILLSSVAYWVMVAITRGFGLWRRSGALVYFIILIIAGAVGSNINWDNNENKYYQILRNKQSGLM